LSIDEDEDTLTLIVDTKLRYIRYNEFQSTVQPRSRPNLFPSPAGADSNPVPSLSSPRSLAQSVSNDQINPHPPPPLPTIPRYALLLQTEVPIPSQTVLRIRQLLLLAELFGKRVAVGEDVRVGREGVAVRLVGEVVEGLEGYLELEEDGFEGLEETSGLEVFRGGDAGGEGTEKKRREGSEGQGTVSDGIRSEREKVSGRGNAHRDTVILDDVPDPEPIDRNRSEAEQPQRGVTAVGRREDGRIEEAPSGVGEEGRELGLGETAAAGLADGGGRGGTVV
jgi:hypothetical protein